MKIANILMSITAVAAFATAVLVGTSYADGIDDIAPAKNISDVMRGADEVDLSKPDARCNRVLYFDFGSWFDAPAYYTDLDGTILARCGGLQRGRLSTDADKSMYKCPAEEWSCLPPNIEAIMKKHQQISESNR